MNDRFYTIQEVADILGVSTKTLRRWDQRGRLVPSRTAGNQRRYSLKQINSLKMSKFSHEEIAGQPSVGLNLPSALKDLQDEKFTSRVNNNYYIKPQGRVSLFRTGLVLAGLVLLLSLTGAMVTTKYNLVAGLAQTKDQFVNFISNLPHLRQGSGGQAQISLAPQNNLAVLAAATGDDLVLNVSVPSFFSQSVGIGTTTAEPSAMLDISSEDKGFLAPRMTTVQRDAISSPAAGLFVYNTDTNHYNMYNGTAWQGVFTSIGDSTTGEAFTETGTAGTTLWFYDTDGRGKLTIANLSGARTYTLPDASGEVSLLGQTISNSELVNSKLTVSPGTNLTGGGEVALGSSITLSLKDSISLAGTLTVAGATALNGNVGLGDAATDTLTFTGRVAEDSDLIPIGTTGTNDLGSSSLPWDNLYVDNIYSPASGYSGYWQRNSQALSPTNITDDLLLGATSTGSAKFGILNIAGGNPTATISSNLSLIVPTGNAPAATFNLLNNGTLNFQRSVGGDAGLATALFIQNNGNVGIGTTGPGEKLEVVGDIISKGTSWTARSAAGNDDRWGGIAYGNGLFVAVGRTNDRVMTSPDGVNWTARSAAGDDDGWQAVTYGNGLFVAVGATNDRVMTSPDGVNWTARSAAGNDDSWNGITYGNGLFVAVSSNNDRVMTSPDGVNWTARSAAGDNDGWLDVTYGNGLFVAVSFVTGSDNRVMTSSDGISWTAQGAAGDDDSWGGIAYGNGLFVAVSSSNDRVMTSPDGVNWTARSAAGDNDVWRAVAYGNGLFVAVGDSGDRVMTSPDGVNWTARSAAGDNDYWYSIAYGNGLFVTVGEADGGGEDVVMTSGKTEMSVLAHNNLYQGGMNIFGNVGIGTTAPTALLDVSGTASVSALTIRGSSPGYINQINGNDLIFRTSPGGDAGLTERMTILNNGNVGIGNTTPGAMLSVGSSAPALISSAGLVTVANTTDSTSGSTGSINTLGGLGVTKDLAVDGGDIVTAATTFNLLNTTATTVNFAGAATTLSIGATTGTTTINNDVTLGNAITDNITFTGRVAEDSDLIPIGTTGTNDLGSSSLPWDNLYVDNIYSPASGYSGYWQRNSQALSPTNITDDLLLGATSTGSAKFGILNIAGGNPTATISSNLSLIVPTGNAPAATFNLLNNGTLNFQRSPGGDAGLATALFIQNNGNVGIGTTTPTSTLEVASSKTINFNSSPVSNLTLGSDMAGGGYNANNLGHVGLGNNTSNANYALYTAEDLSDASADRYGIYADLHADQYTTRSNSKVGVAGTAYRSGSSWGNDSAAFGTFGYVGVLGSAYTGAITVGGHVESVAAIKAGTWGSNNAAGITTTDAVGVYISSPLTGNLANAYGLYINTVSGASTLNYALYSAGGTNYFGGNVGIGNTTPLTALDITGSASLSANLSLRGAETAHTFNILDNGTLNIQRSPGGDADLATALFIQNNGSVGIGNTTPGAMLSVGSSTPTLVSSAGLITVANTTDSTSGSTGSINTLGGLGVTKDLAVDGGDIVTGATTFNLLNTTATTVNFAGAATALNLADAAITGTIDIGGVTADGTTTVNIATNGTANADIIAIGNSNASTTLALTGGDDWNVTVAGAATFASGTFNGNVDLTSDLILNIGDTGTDFTAGGGLTLAGAALLNADVTLGNAITDNITFTGRVAQDSDLIPIGTTGTNDLGSSSLPWDNIYVNSVIAGGTSGIFGWLQRNSQALSPTNITDDILVGGTATSSAIIRLAGTNVGGANLLDVFNSGSSVFNVSANQINNNIPVAFNAPGDVSMAYDLQFTNPTASYIKSYGPLYIQSGDPNQNVDLVLSAAGTGNVLVADTFLAQDTTDSTTAYQFNNSSGTTILNIDTTNSRVGIGNTTPLAALDLTGTASLSANINLNGAATAHTFNILDNGTLNFQRSPGGDAGLATALFIQNNGNVGIGNTTPGAMLSVGSSTPALISSAGLITVANTTDSTSGSTGSINTLGGLGVTKDLAVDGGDIVTGATTFNLINATATTVNFAGAATTLSIGATTGTTTINNDITLGNAITDNITFTGRVAEDSDLIPIGTTGTNDLGSAALPWDNLYVDNIFSPSAGVSGYWQRSSGALSPTNLTDDLLLGATSTGSAKFGILNIAGGNPTATMSSNLSLIVPTGNAPAATFNLLNNGTLNFQRSAGGDAGLATALFIQNNGNVGIGNTTPGAMFSVGSSTPALVSSAGLVTIANTTDSTSGSTGSINTLGGLGITKDLAVDGGDIVTAATTFNLLNTTATTVNFAGAATTLSIGATTGTTTINNDVTLGNAITDNITFTGRVAEDSDLIPIGTTGTNDLGSSSLPWDNLYVDNIYSPASGYSGYWQRNSQALSPTNITDDLLLGATSTGSAKFGILNIAGGSPTATISSNLSLIVPTGNAPAATFNLLNNGTLNFQRSPGGDAGLAANSVLFMQNNGNVGIGMTNPLATLDITGSASMSANLSLRGNATAHTFDILDNGTLNFRRSPGGSGQTTSLFIQGDGYIGIGTTVPGALLTLANDSWIGGISTSSGTTNMFKLNTADQIQVGAALNMDGGIIFPTDGGNLVIADMPLDSSAQGTANSYTFKIGSDNILTVYGENSATSGTLQNGRVGIGTSAPLTTLDVRGNLGTGATASISAASSFASLIVDNTIGDLFTASSSGVPQFVIRNNGAVGLGVNLPTQRLDVNGNINIATGNTYKIAGTDVLSGTTLGTGVLTSSLTTVGTIGTGVWQGTSVKADYGGTGVTAYTQGDILYAGSLNPTALSKLAASTTGYVLTTNGAGTNPTWTDPSVSAGNFWRQNSGALYPNSSTVDLLIGGTSTAAAKFAFINTSGGDPTATISGNLSLAVPTTAGANTFNLLNNSTLNFQRSPGGDAGLATALFIQSNGNVGIGNTTPGAMLSVGSSTPALISSAGLITIANTTDSTSGSTGSINTLGGLGITKDLAVDGGDIVTAATTFNLINATATTVNFAGAATTLNLADAAITGTIDLGGVTADGTTTVNIATNGTANADTIAIGNSNAGTTLALTGGDDWNVTVAGAATFASGTFNGNVDLTSDLILNIGDTGTDFTAGGGLTLAGAALLNADVTLGNAITDNITFTGRVAQDSDLIPIGTTGTNDLGSSALPWDNLYVDNIYSPASGYSGYWQRNAQALSPTNITDDLLLGATSTASAKFGILNIAGGNPTATISSNLSLIVPTGNAPAATFNLLNNGTLNFQRSPGGDADLATALFIQNNGNVGIGTTAPATLLDINGTLKLGGTVTGNNQTINNLGSIGLLNETANTNYGLYSAEVWSNPGNGIRTGGYFDTGVTGSSLLASGNVSSIILANNYTGSSGEASPGQFNGARIDVTGNLDAGATNLRTFANGGGLIGINLNSYHAVNNSSVFTALTGLYINNWGAAGAAGTVTDAAAIYIKSPLSTGTLTNAYGLYMENITGGDTLNYSIYSAGGTNYFGGNVGIGNTAPLAALDITGSASMSANLSLRGNATAHTFDILDNGSLNFRKSPGGSGQTTSLFIQGDGYIGIGTTVPGALLTLANNSWIGGISTASGTTNMFKLNTADQIQVGAALNIDGGINFPSDAGYVTAMDLPLTSAQSAGTANGYVFRLGTSNLMTVYGENNGSGVLQNGRIGIGTTAPLLRLDVQDSQSASAAAQIYNTDTGTNADGLIVKLGNTSTSAVNAANHFLSFETFGIGIVGSVQGSGGTGVTYATSGIADFAEYFKKDQNQSIPFGSVVCLQDNGLAAPCDNNNGKIIGVASERPAFLGGENLGDRSVPVGMVGQVRTRVSTAKGEIKIGDPLTASETSGIAVKATQTGQILGKAVESYNGQGEGTVLVSVNIGWYNPSIYVSYDGTLTGMATTINSIGDQLALQGESLQAQIASNSASLAAQTDYILANDPLFDSLNNKVADLRAKIDLLSQKADQQASISAFLMDIVSSQILGASTSAALDLGDVELNNAIISDNLNVLGRTTVSDLGVTGNINAGLLAIHGLDGEINTLAGDLYLQKNGLGGVDILDGKVVIDTQGNIIVSGTVTAEAVEANNYSVLGDQSIGSATISAGLTYVEISTPIANDSSKIFLTPTTLTDKQLIVVKKSNGKFKVAIPLPATSTPITFDWWIVGNK